MRGRGTKWRGEWREWSGEKGVEGCCFAAADIQLEVINERKQQVISIVMSKSDVDQI